MSIHHEVLGQPGRDNALWVTIDAGHSTSRLLFDCGEGCLGSGTKSFGDITTLDELFFSHLHMDHVGGFDSFFRCNFSRNTRPNRIWGPPDTARILQHRFRGFLWNLYDELEGTWFVSDIGTETVRTTRFELHEGFETPHDAGDVPFTTTILEHEAYSVETMPLDHRTPSMAYLVREPARWNIDPDRLAASGLRPGAWMQRLKADAPPDATVEVGGTTYLLEILRRDLLIETPGESVAYLSDFRLDDETLPKVVSWLSGCGTLVCESQYRHADAEIATRHRHMTTRLTATLAREAGVGNLVLIHLSDRYPEPEWLEMLDEAREVFPETSFPSHWKIDSAG